MMSNAERKEMWAAQQAMQLAFYALAEALEAKGLVEGRELVAMLRSFNDPSNPRLMANLKGLAVTIETRLFNPDAGAKIANDT